MTNFQAIQDGDFNDELTWTETVPGLGNTSTLVPTSSDNVTIGDFSITADSATVSVLDADGSTLIGSYTALQSMELDDVTLTGGQITSDGGLGLTDVTMGGSPVQADSLDAQDLSDANATVTTNVSLGGTTTNANISAGSLDFTGTMSDSEVTYDGDTSPGSGTAILSGTVSTSTISGFSAITMGGEFDSTTVSSTSGIAVVTTLTSSGLTLDALTVSLAYDGTLQGVDFDGVEEVTNEGSLTIASGQTIAAVDFTSSAYVLVSSGAAISVSDNIGLVGSSDIEGNLSGSGVAISGDSTIAGSITTTGPATEEEGASVLIGGGSETISGTVSASGNIDISKLGGVAAQVVDFGDITTKDELEVTGASLFMLAGTINADSIDVENGFGTASFTGGGIAIGTFGDATFNAATFSLQDASLDVGGVLAFGDPGPDASSARFNDSTVTVGDNFTVSSTADVVLGGGSSVEVTGVTDIGDSEMSNAGLSITDGSLLEEGGSLIDVASDNDLATGTLDVTGFGSSLIGHSATLSLGGEGTGFANIENGGSVGVATVDIGIATDSSGVLLVSGDFSALTASSMEIGSGASGSGTLDIQDEAEVIADNVIITANGTVKLDNSIFSTDTVTLSAGGVIVASGIARVDGSILGLGSIVIDPAGTLSLTGSVAAGIIADFAAGGSETMSIITQSDAFSGTIVGFSSGDVIDLGAFASVSSNFVGNKLTVTSGGAQIAALQFVGNFAASNSIVAQVVNGTAEVVVACYAEGTHIATPDGERVVEGLRVGDMVTASGGERRSSGSVSAAWIAIDTRSRRKSGPCGLRQVRSMRPFRIAIFGCRRIMPSLWRTC